jgi:uncharacterized damage-inducible protein DinB
MVRVDAVLDSWKTVREDTAAAVEEFPASDFDFKPVSDVMTFRELATHILQAGHGLTGLLLDGVENLAVPEFRSMLTTYFKQLPPHDTPAGLASALRSAAELRCAELARQTSDFYAGMITRFDGQRVTRLEMLQMVKEHELTHRSQMFMYLRLKGLVPATTRRRQSKAKA